MLAPAGRHSLASLAAPSVGGRVELLVGAEGGLAPEEIVMARLAIYGMRVGKAKFPCPTDKFSRISR